MGGRLIEQSRRRLLIKGWGATALAVLLVCLVGITFDRSPLDIGLTALLVLLLGAFCTWRVSRSLGEVIAVMEQLGRGKTDIVLPSILGQDEIARLFAVASRYRDVILRLQGAEAELKRQRVQLMTLEGARDIEDGAAQKWDGEPLPNSVQAVVFDLAATVRGLGTVLSSQAKAKGLGLVVELAPGLPSFVVGDPSSLGQVLIQLAGNAIRFSSRGDIVVSVRETLRTDCDVELQFSVLDTGMGLTPRQQAAFFRAFSPGDDSAIGGLGLGLTISKRLVESMGGSMRMESRYGAGSTFHFTARLKIETPYRIALGNQLSGPVLLGRKMLLVGDAEHRQEGVVDILRQAGLTVRSVANGVEALQAVREQVPDCILMDCRMPVMDGFEATSRLRSLGYSRLPIIGLADNALSSNRERGLAAGMNELLGRPDDVKALVFAVGRWMRQPQSRNPIRSPAMVRAIPSESSGHGLALPPLPPGLDVESALKRLQGKTALFLTTLRTFRDSRGDQFQIEFQSAIAAEDWQTSERLANSLKGTAAAIGANEVSAAAAVLEASIRDGEYEKVPSLFAGLTDKLRSIVDGLAHIG